MTPQSSFMVLAPIDPAREAELRALLDSMNTAPGRVDATNQVIPFAQFDRLHFARLVILADNTTEDVQAHGLTPRTYPLYLAFLGDVDGEEDAILDELVTRAAGGLRTLWSCCQGFSAETELRAWMTQHRSPPQANYINWRGRTVRQIHEEAALERALEQRLADRADALSDQPPRVVHTALRAFVDIEVAAGRLTLSDEAPTPLRWWIANTLHLLGLPLLALLASPLLLLAAPFYAIMLRRREKTDPVVAPTVNQQYSDNLARFEDHGVTNQFSAMGSLKPGLFRLLTVIGVLATIDYAARHIVKPGRLGRIRTIHFARWVFVAGTERMIFFSNYDHSVETYMDDFINKTGFGLNASFSNAIGYPTTNWLILGGCADEQKYKEYLRRHTIPTQVWYKAYPGLTAIDLERNTRIRAGLAAATLTEAEARDWVALL